MLEPCRVEMARRGSVPCMAQSLRKRGRLCVSALVLMSTTTAGLRRANAAWAVVQHVVDELVAVLAERLAAVGAFEPRPVAERGEVDVGGERCLLRDELAPQLGARRGVGHRELENELEAAVEGGVCRGRRSGR